MRNKNRTHGKKLTLLLLTFSLLTFLLVSLSAQAKVPSEKGPKTSKILLYGSERCGICQGFFKNMKKENIEFKFIDVNKDRSAAAEMWDKVREVNPNARSVRFPVIDIDGKVLVSPDYQTFKTEYNRSK